MSYSNKPKIKNIFKRSLVLGTIYGVVPLKLYEYAVVWWTTDENGRPTILILNSLIRV